MDLINFGQVGVEGITYYVGVKFDWHIWRAVLENYAWGILLSADAHSLNGAVENLDIAFYEYMKKCWS